VPDNPNEITIDNSVLIFIDHQPWVAFSVKSIDAGLLVNNLAGLAASAKALDVPTILTTVGAKGILNDPPIKGLADALPDVMPIDRSSTNAWEDIRGLGFDERFRRLWNYYLCYCEAGFTFGSVDVRQIALTCE